MATADDRRLAREHYQEFERLVNEGDLTRAGLELHFAHTGAADITPETMPDRLLLAAIRRDLGLLCLVRAQEAATPTWQRVQRGFGMKFLASSARILRTVLAAPDPEGALSEENRVHIPRYYGERESVLIARLGDVALPPLDTPEAGTDALDE